MIVFFVVLNRANMEEHHLTCFYHHEHDENFQLVSPDWLLGVGHVVTLQ